MKVTLDGRIKKEFPDLFVKPFTIGDLKIKKASHPLEEFKQKSIKEIKEDYDIETVKDSLLIRRYRDFYWRIGIDPTKIRPASEALIRRVLKDKPLPRINTLVDTYNFASMKTNIALAAFDFSTIKGDLSLLYAKEGDEFRGIGMQKSITLKGNEPIIRDEEKTIAVYPYRDSDQTKITENTETTLILVCGVPGITESMINKTQKITTDLIIKYCT